MRKLLIVGKFFISAMANKGSREAFSAKVNSVVFQILSGSGALLQDPQFHQFKLKMIKIQLQKCAYKSNILAL